jgi:hypothetical protein
MGDAALMQTSPLPQIALAARITQAIIGGLEK